MKKKTYPPMGLIPFVIIAMLFFSSGSVFASPVKVVVLPFHIHAEKDLDFLKTGIQDMLSSRLAWKDKVVVMDKTDVNNTVKSLGNFKGQSLALLVGGKLKADYIISGSVTVLGQGASIDATLRDITGKKAPVTFFKQTNSLSGVIPEINRFATDVNEKIFHKTYAIETSNSMSTSHQFSSNKKNLNNTFSNVVAANTQGLPNQNFIPEKKYIPNNTQQKSFWQSRQFNQKIVSIAIGDINNDNTIETLIASDHSVSIYQVQNGHLKKIIEIARVRASFIIGLDIGDINNNGIPEIFITTLTNDRRQATSLVLEFNGSTYSKIVSNSPYQYRIVKNSNSKPVLLGQILSTKRRDAFSSPIYKMIWQKSNYVQDEILFTKGNASVLGTTFAPISESNKNDIIAFNENDHLQIFQKNGNLRGNTDIRYGGNMSYCLIPKTDPTEFRDTIQYYPLRIVIDDTNHDNIQEIIVGNNIDSTGGMLPIGRKYTKGRIESLTWNGRNLVTNWKTKNLPGRISDYCIGDFDNDGGLELVISIISKEDSVVFTNTKSFIVSYDLM